MIVIFDFIIIIIIGRVTIIVNAIIIIFCSYYSLYCYCLFCFCVVIVAIIVAVLVPVFSYLKVLLVFNIGTFIFVFSVMR